MIQDEKQKLEKIIRQHQSDQNELNQENLEFKSKLRNLQHKLKKVNREEVNIIYQLKLEAIAKENKFVMMGF